jgi:NAD(P)-dependent dehydrogenase (short-subunit alcohol dehydrogenase family)
MNVGLTSAMILAARLKEFMSPGATMMFVSASMQDGGANWLPYYTSKRALEDFVKGLAQDETDIRVYGVSPSNTATDAYKKFYPSDAATAQAPTSVAKVVVDLIENKLTDASGTIVEVRDGQISMGYHK